MGWVACITLALSLTYTFVRALIDGPGDVDPLFFGLQAVASTLFLVYSLRLKNRIFVVANAVAVANAHLTGTVNGSYQINGVKGGYIDLSGRFPQAEVSLLTSFAAHAVVALENARTICRAARSPISRTSTSRPANRNRSPPGRPGRTSASRNPCARPAGSSSCRRTPRTAPSAR